MEFLRRQGEKLISSGQDKRRTSDHSITVHGNEWYDHAAERAVSYTHLDVYKRQGRGTVLRGSLFRGWEHTGGHHGWNGPSLRRLSGIITGIWTEKEPAECKIISQLRNKVTTRTTPIIFISSIKDDSIIAE